MTKRATCRTGQGFCLALANELTGERPWLGELHRVALYARVLDAAEVGRSVQTGRDRTAANPIVLYEFREGTGDVVKDTSGTGTPLELKVKDPSAVQWLADGGLRITTPTTISSAEPAGKLIQAVRRSQAITIEAWIKPANATQAGPARIVTLSKDTSGRNFTLGQKAGAYEVRFRTTTTSANGEPALSSPGGDEAAPAAVGLRTPKGDLAVLYFSAGGSAGIRSGLIETGTSGEEVQSTHRAVRRRKAQPAGRLRHARWTGLDAAARSWRPVSTIR